MKRTFIIGLSVFTALLATGGNTFAQIKQTKPAKQTKPPVKKPIATKGQGQLIGGIGQFGETYTLKRDFNFALLGAYYSVKPIGDYGTNFPNYDQKLLVLEFSLKNVAKSDNWFGGEGFFTAVDSKGGLYPNFGALTLQSVGKNTKTSLRPGQGIGQPALKDSLRACVVIPSDARIVKIMVNSPRLNITEEVFRYYIAGATKEEAGEPGDPKNIIAPLPDSIRDSSDPSGATALASGKGTVGSTTNDCISNLLHFRVNSVTHSTENLYGNPPEEGKEWVIVTITAAFPLPAGKSADFSDIGSFDFPGYGGGYFELTDADGDKYALAGGLLKASKDELVADNRTIKVGEDFTYRLTATVPKGTKLKTLTLGATNGRRWAFSVQ